MKIKNITKAGFWLCMSFAVITIFSCSSDKDTIKIKVENPTSMIVKDAVLELDNADFLKNITDKFKGDFHVKLGDQLLPYQKVDANGDGKPDELLVLCDLKADQTAELSFEKNDGKKAQFTKRTQAELSIKEGGEWTIDTKPGRENLPLYEGGTFKNISYLRVPDEHTDHSEFIRYEGPGWESDKIGYRFYLDWRNAADIFGKKIPEMVLQGVGQDGFESYHEPGDWGMDVLKVGGSLGIGSIGYWTGEKAQRVAHTDSVICQILQNGDLRSSIETNYYGWSDPNVSTDLTSTLSIDAGSRLTHVVLKTSPAPDNLCTGIVKHDSAEIIQREMEGGPWAYLATFGKQSLNDDNLGMVIFYKKADLINMTEDAESHVLVLNPSSNTLDYYFAATWEPDVDSIATIDEFNTYLDETLNRLNNPVKISY